MTIVWLPWMTAESVVEVMPVPIVPGFLLVLRSMRVVDAVSPDPAVVTINAGPLQLMINVVFVVGAVLWRDTAIVTETWSWVVVAASPHPVAVTINAGPLQLMMNAMFVGGTVLRRETAIVPVM